MSAALVALTNKLAARFDIDGAGEELVAVLKATAFKGPATDAQMTALMIVANQHGLNPWTKEIYAFPDKNNGIVPVVGVDGWSRIINEHPQFDGMEFEFDNEGCTCSMYRKDRSRAVRVTEYMDECKRGTQPWQSHPRRMLRHKALIQCARLAFGYTGIYDQDEAERIVESQPVEKFMGDVKQERQQWPADEWAKTLPKIIAGIRKGKSIDDALAWLRAKADLTQEQEAELRSEAAAIQSGVVIDQATGEIQTAAPEVDFSKLLAAIKAAKNEDELAEHAALIGAVSDEAQRIRLSEAFQAKATELNGD